MALGADAREVRRLILRQTLRPVLIGALIGVAACVGVAQVITSMLFGVSPHDPIAFSAVPLFLVAVAWLAARVPAERATRVEPMIALRWE